MSTITPSGSFTLPLPGVSGLRVERRFTTERRDPFDSFTWVRRRAAITDHRTGETKFAMDVEVPDTWDQTAVDVLAAKYCRKAGVPQTDPTTGEAVLDDAGDPVLGPETSAKQVIGRIVLAWRTYGERHGYFASEQDLDAYADEMAFMLAAQMGAPNSPQWFNTGVWEAYGIVEDSEGNTYYDPEADEVVESAHKYARVAANACFINRVEDNLVGDNGIMAYATREARLFKGGSGSGANVSTLREAGAPLTAGGSSSGALSFLKAIDRMAGAIKSGGSTRRAARMVIMDADHPDIEAFIDTKVDAETIARDLIAAGYDRGYDTEGGAYDIVPWQNANHSIRIPRGFKELLDDDADLELVSRKTLQVVRTVKARELWDKIAQAAHYCADPGVQFDGIINDWATTPADGRIRGSNPCSEYLHVDDTACNLASINLGQFFDADTQTFDVDGYAHAARLWTITLEITVAMSHYPDPTVARTSYDHRTLGLGYANLGALLMRAGLPYDSREGRAVIGAVTSLMTMVAWATSAELSAAVGPCAAYTRNVEPTLRVLRNHRRAAYGSDARRAGVEDYDNLEVVPVDIDHRVLARTVFASLSDPVKAAADHALEHAATHGVRNAQVSVIAPTGTIGLVMSCDTTGCEPDFALVKWKKLAGGGYMKIVNGSVPPALAALGYTSTEIASILAYALGTGTLSGAQSVNRAALVAAGLTDGVVDAAEAALPTAGNLAMAFAPFVIGADEYVARDLDPATAGGADLLGALGFTASQILESSQVVCGHETVEGAPALREEDLPVFDTANRCGDGTRYIHWSGHVHALAAIQPHVSGGISKTVNLPNDATVDDIRAVHDLAYDTGVKCVAVYRDGSKASQPLSSTLDDTDHNDDDPTSELAVLGEVAPGMSPTDYYAGHMPPRFRLPDIRAGHTFKFDVGGQDIYLQTGLWSDGTVGELFISLAKDGSTLRGVFSQFAIAISLGLQRGVPLSHYVDKFVGQNFAPNGPVRMNGGPLRMCTSIPDAIFRILGWYYLGRDELVQVPDAPGMVAERGAAPAHADTTAAEAVVAQAAAAAAVPAKPTVNGTAKPAAKAEPTVDLAGSPFTGDLCPECSSARMVRSGTCQRCLDCSATTGCS